MSPCEVTFEGRGVGRALRWAVNAALAFATACSYDCPAPHDDSKALVLDIGYTNPERTVYESTPPDGAYQYAAPGQVLAFRHRLVGRPRIFQVLLAFDEHPLAPGGTGNVALSAGNESAISCVDSEFLVARNDSCETSFFWRVSASDPVLPGEDDPSQVRCRDKFPEAAAASEGGAPAGATSDAGASAGGAAGSS